MNKEKKVSFLLLLLALAVFLTPGMSAEAKGNGGLKKDYINTLSALIRTGTESADVSEYQRILKKDGGKTYLRQAALSNRAALMAEGIDALDESFLQYYAVSAEGEKATFHSTKTVSRRAFKKRYAAVRKGLQKMLGCVEASMTDADKAMAVYIYLTKNTTYQASADCHTGYDVIVNQTGVCDGLANAYALAMTTLDIPCVVVSSYDRDHSWNLVELDDQWYFVDLTVGVGPEEHTGMTPNYKCCLAGMETFLRTHAGYSRTDACGQANSDGLVISSLSLAQEDYMDADSALSAGLSLRTCTFYHGGYWYFISTENVLKKARLDGSAVSVVFSPQEDEYIGWIDEYQGTVYLSLNDVICRMDYRGNNLLALRRVSAAEYYSEATSYFWQIAYVGRFSLDENGRQLYVTNALPFELTSVKWKSSNPKVVSVDKNGYVTAKKKGTAVVTATVGKRKLRCTVRVTGYTIRYRRVSSNASGNVRTATGKRSVVLGEPTREGYTFAGWYEDKKYTRQVTSIPKGNAANRVLYAKWTKN